MATIDGPAPVIDVATIDGPPPACVGSLEGGTHADTVFYPVSGRVGLSSTATMGGGVFVSQLFDGITPNHEWSRISWAPARPLGKPLPDDGMAETAYDDGGADMQHNVFLAHLDELPGAADFFDTADATPLHGTCGATAMCPTAGFDAATFGTAVDFPETGGARIDFPDDLSLEPEHFTVEAWVAVDSVPGGNTTGMAVTKGHDADADWTMGEAFTSYSIEFDAALSQFKCYVGFAGVNDAERTLVAGPPAFMPMTGPVHVACTYDGAEVHIFVNGQDRGMAPQTAPVLYGHPEDGLYVGAWYGFQYLDGRVDEVAIFDEALPAATIRDHYLRGAGRIRFQVRSCPTEECDGGGGPDTMPWVGPDGTALTYYTEQCRPPGGAIALGLPSMTLDDIDCDGDGMNDHPSPDPPIAPNRYVQFRASFQLQGPPTAADALEVQLVSATICQ